MATASGSFTFFNDSDPTTVTSASDSVTVDAIQLPELTLDKSTSTST